MQTRLTLLRAAGLATLAVAGLIALFQPLAVRGGDDRSAPPSDIVVQADGEVLAIDLAVATVRDALDAAGVVLADADAVAIAGTFFEPEDDLPQTAGATGPLELDVRRAVAFTLVEDGIPREVRSSRPTVGAALAHLGLALRPEDVVVPATAAPLASAMRVSVKYARPLVVRLPDQDMNMLTQAPTVAGALDAAGVPLPEEYRLEPAADAPVTSGLEVRVVALGTNTEVEDIPVAAGATRELDPSLAPGEERTVDGQDGTLHREWSVSYENGVEVGRELLNEWFDPQPADAVTYYGPDPTATPTPPPTPTPVPPRRPSGGTGGAEQWRSIVCSYDWDCEYALAVIRCESNGNPDSVNPAGPYIGLFQIWHGYGGDLYDPIVNIAAAYAIYTRSGWSPWPNCP